MLSFKALTEKKTNIKVNPKLADLKEAGKDDNHGEDCDCMKCEKKRMKGSGEKEVATESAVPGKPAERVGALTNIDIPQSERDAAKARTLAKAKAAREKRMKEEVEIEEGMTLKDFNANRKKNERRAASADAEKRGHVGKEWHNTGRKYSADDAKSNRAKLSDDDRAARHRAAVDPDDDRDENTYSADKTKNPKKLRKQKAMGEIKKEETAYDRQEEVSKESNQSIAETETLLTFGQFQEARNAYAVGMAAAMKQTGDTPPLEKSTIKKAHKIAKAIKKEEVEIIDELNRAEKETGINTKTGRPTQKGGAKDDKAFTMVKQSIRKMEGTPAGQRKKEKGKKPPAAGEYGAPKSPAQKLAMRRAAAKRSQDNMSSRFD